jgi:hypothetical protein
METTVACMRAMRGMASDFLSEPAVKRVGSQ